MPWSLVCTSHTRLYSVLSGIRTVVVQGSNPATATYSLRNFGNSVYPALPVSFGGDTKSCRSLLSGVYASGNKISHQSAMEMCNLSCTPPPTLRNQTSSCTTLEISRKTFVCYAVNMMCSKSKKKHYTGIIMPWLSVH